MFRKKMNLIFASVMVLLSQQAMADCSIAVLGNNVQSTIVSDTVEEMNQVLKRAGTGYQAVQVESVEEATDYRYLYLMNAQYKQLGVSLTYGDTGEKVYGQVFDQRTFLSVSDGVEKVISDFEQSGMSELNECKRY